MNRLIDGADRVYWWLRQHPPVAGGIGAGIVVVIVLLLVVGGGDDKPKVPASAVAAVDGTPISNESLQHWISVYDTANTSGQKPTAAESRKAAFELLAGSTWITKEAERQHVVVTEADAEKATSSYLQQAATASKLTQAQVLQQMGTNKADLAYQQRISLLASKLQQKVIKAVPAPTTAQINAEYTSDPGRWANLMQRDVEAIITTSKADADAALKELQGGATFKTVNGKYSSNATLSSAGGALKELKPGSTDTEVEKPIFAAPTGKLMGPAKAGDGYIVFRVTKSTPLATQTLAQATAKIKQDLTTAAQTKATDSFLKELRKRWQPQTTCRASVSSSTYCGARA